MTPTMKLRFVERRNISSFYKVLQQWWAMDATDELAIMLGHNGEWRDVPLGKEE